MRLVAMLAHSQGWPATKTDFNTQLLVTEYRSEEFYLLRRILECAYGWIPGEAPHPSFEGIDPIFVNQILRTAKSLGSGMKSRVS